MRTGAAAGLLLCLDACGGGQGAPPPAPGAVAEAPDWRRIATPADRERLRRWREAWARALSAARAAAPRQVAAQGALFAYDTASPDPVPPAGDYRCRVFKLGAKGAGMRDFTTYPWFVCRVTDMVGDGIRLEKLSGSQRHVGTIHRADGMRAAFLGTLLLGDEVRPFAYGRDAARDVAGWIERVERARWRLAMPYPAFESTLDVLELVPAG